MLSNNLDAKTGQQHGGLLLRDDGSLEPGGIGQMKIAEITASQIGAFKAGVGYICVPQTAARECCFAEICFGQIRAFEVNFFEFGPTERQSAKLGVDQQASLKLETQRARVKNLHAGELAILEPGGGQDRPGPVGVVEVAGDEAGVGEIARREIRTRGTAAYKFTTVEIDPLQRGFIEVPPDKANRFTMQPQDGLDVRSGCDAIGVCGNFNT